MKKILMIAAGAMMLAGGSGVATAQDTENPFLKPYTTKYGIPPYDKI